MVDTTEFDEYMLQETRRYEHVKAIKRSIMNRTYPYEFWDKHLKCENFRRLTWNKIKRKPESLLLITTPVPDKVLYSISKTKIKSYTPSGTVSIDPFDIILPPNPNLLQVIELIYSRSKKFNFSMTWALIGVSRSFNQHFGSKGFWNRNSGYGLFLSRMKEITPVRQHCLLEEIEPLSLLSGMFNKHSRIETNEILHMKTMLHSLFMKVFAELCQRMSTLSIANASQVFVKAHKSLLRCISNQNDEGWMKVFTSHVNRTPATFSFKRLAIEVKHFGEIEISFGLVQTYMFLCMDHEITQICTKTVLAWISKSEAKGIDDKWIVGHWDRYTGRHKPYSGFLGEVIKEKNRQERKQPQKPNIY